MSTACEKIDEKSKSSMKEVWPQLIAVSIKNTLLITYGMTLGYPTILIPGLSDRSEEIKVSPEEISWISSINLICVPVGCTISGMFAQAVGRKKAMQYVNIPLSMAWLIFYFSTEIWHIMLALALTGLTGGLLEAPVLTYVAEIAQPHLRGMLSSTSSMSVILGILIQFLLGTLLHWRIVALASLAFPVFSYALLFIVPESPQWLVVKHRTLEAQQSLAWLRGTTDIAEIQAEYKDLYAGQEKPRHDPTTDTSTRWSRWQDTCMLFTRRDFLWPFALITFVFFVGQFSGMATLQTYAVQTFETLRAPLDKFYCTVILGVVQLIGSGTCVAAVHYVGKRFLCFTSLIGSTVCFVAVATYAFYIDVIYFTFPNTDKIAEVVSNVTSNYTTEANNEMIIAEFGWIPMVFLIGAAFICSMGIRVLPWILIGEVYSNETRSAASGLSGAVGYIFGFLANKCFLSLVALLTIPGTFWMYGGVSAIGAIILYFCLPETEGKTLAEINEHFAGGKHMGNNVITKKRCSTVEEAGVTAAGVEDRIRNVNLAFVPEERYTKRNEANESKL